MRRPLLLLLVSGAAHVAPALHCPPPRPAVFRRAACSVPRASAIVAAADDPYAVLGVKRGATAAEIKQAYRRMALRSHPDVNKAPDAEANFAKIAEAYSILSDTKKRSQYDRSGRGSWSSSSSSSSASSARRSSSSAPAGDPFAGWDPSDPIGWASRAARDLSLIHI